MKSLTIMLLYFLLGMKCFSDGSKTGEDEWYSFNTGVERDKNCFQMKFPYDYIIDPRSSLSGGIVDFPGFEPRAKNTPPSEIGFEALNVSSPKGTVQIAARNFISVEEEFKKMGFSEVREVILTYVETPWLASVDKKENYEVIRYQSKNKLEIVLYYIPYDVKFSSRVPCRLLYLRFKKLSDYKNNQKQVELIIRNFIPF